MTYMAEKKREIVRMGLTAESKQALDQMAADRDMTLIGILSRTVDWLVQQDKTLQSVILGLVDEADAPDVLGLIHKRLAQQLTEKHLDKVATLDQARGSVGKRSKKARRP